MTEEEARVKKTADGRKWRLANPERWDKILKRYRTRIRQEFLDAYGNCCSCCGETIPEFLTLEHKRHDGKAHRAILKQSTVIYLDLRRRGWPKDDYTIFCMNCNFATRYGKPCPHQRIV